MQTLWSRELRIGGERSDIALPGEQDAFGETLQEYLPLLFCAIEADRGGTLRRLLELGVNANGYFCGQTRRLVVRQRLAVSSSCVSCTHTALTSICRG